MEEQELKIQIQNLSLELNEYKNQLINTKVELMNIRII